MIDIDLMAEDFNMELEKVSVLNEQKKTERRLKKFPCWVLEVRGHGYYYDTKQECIEKRQDLINKGECIIEQCIIYYDSGWITDLVK